MHLDEGISINAVKKAIREFLPDYVGIERCKAIILGGWKSVLKIRKEKSQGIALLKFLDENKVQDVESYAYRFAGDIRDSFEHAYESIILNLETGILTVNQTFDHQFRATDGNLSTIRSWTMSLLNSSCSISETLQLMNEACSKKCISTETEQFLRTLQENEDGTPLIPFKDVKAKASSQLLALARAATSGDSIEVLRLLYSNFSPAIAGLPEYNGNTPLHFACKLLNNNPQKIEYKLIICYLILSGKDDTPDKNNILALDTLMHGSLQTFKEKCKLLIDALQSYSDMLEMDLSITQMSIIKVVLLEATFTHRKNAENITSHELDDLLLTSIDLLTSAYEKECRKCCRCVIS